MTKLQRIAKLLKNRNARIVGICNHDSERYYIIQNLIQQTTEHVLVDDRSSWEKIAKFWITKAELESAFG